jgi:transcriptional regulator with XRE-family HTH domain
LPKTATSKERRAALGLTVDQFSTYARLDPNIGQRIEAGGMKGTHAESRYLAALDAYDAGKQEPDSLFPKAGGVDPKLGYDPNISRWQEQPTRAAQEAAQKAVADRQAAFKAEWEAKAAERRAANAEKYRRRAMERIDAGLELKELRERAGLSQTEMGHLCGLSLQQVSWIERGNPHYLWDKIEEIRAQYEMAARAPRSVEA